MVERCALSGSDLKIKFRTILLTSILIQGFASEAPNFICLYVSPLMFYEFCNLVY